MIYLPLAVRLLGIEQRDAAAAAGLHPSTVNRVLRGKQGLSAESIARLEAAAIALAERVRIEREAQGLPAHVDDLITLRKIAALVTENRGQAG